MVNKIPNWAATYQTSDMRYPIIYAAFYNKKNAIESAKQTRKEFKSKYPKQKIKVGIKEIVI